MLLPALNQARNKANDVVCKSNLSNMGKLLIIYMDDYDGYAPKKNMNNSAGKYRRWMSYLAGTSEMSDSAATAWMAKGKSFNLFICPSYAHQFKKIKPHEFGRSSYSMNIYFNGSFHGSTKIVRNMGRKEPIIADAMPEDQNHPEFGANVFQFRNGNNPYGLGSYHSGGDGRYYPWGYPKNLRGAANALWVDGHAKTLTAMELSQPVKSAEFGGSVSLERMIYTNMPSYNGGKYGEFE
jgi:prepilin-type processing-associated H-X9-DG protein